MDPLIGTILPVGFNFAPDGWALCDGSLMSISEYDAAFSLLGTTFGGDGVTTFGLPDLRGRVPVNQGTLAGGSSYVMGQKSGTENVTLNTTQLPAHTHPTTLNVNNGQASNAVPVTSNSLAAMGTGGGRDPFVPVNAYTAASANVALSNSSVTLQVVGGTASHTNLQPYQVQNYIICLLGIYPQRP